mgnify:FL=1
MEKIKDSISFIIIILIIIIIRLFIVTPVRVDGPSMNDTLHDGDILLLDKYDNKYERFEIVVFNYSGERLIKRVIGLPGEVVSYKNNKLYINGNEIEDNYGLGYTENFELKDLNLTKIPDNEYLVMGDNRNDSLDSRYFGTISKDKILGSVKYRLFPFNKFGKVN